MQLHLAPLDNTTKSHTNTSRFWANFINDYIDSNKGSTTTIDNKVSMSARDAYNVWEATCEVASCAIFTIIGQYSTNTLSTGANMSVDLSDLAMLKVSMISTNLTNYSTYFK